MGLVTRDDGVAFPAVVQRPAVGDDNIVVFPLVAKYIKQKVFVGAAGFAIQTVVATHNLLHIAVFNDILKRRQICSPEVAG